MELIGGLLYGFSVLLTPANLFACFVGVFVGTLIGVLPGIGPVATMSLLLPVTYAMSPTASIIMMAGIYYGAMYGGSTTSILVNIPGRRRRWSPVWTATRWRARVGPGPPSASPPSDRSSRERSACSASCSSPRR